LLCLPDAELSILFVGSARMKSLNSEYRGIPRETDVLSFAMNEGVSFPPGASRFTSRSSVLGDIVISVPRTAKQAAEYGFAFREELQRLLMHGLLHLAGYDHEKGRRQRLEMEKKERELLHAVQGMD
jgi:probable rRNA maturation factor